MVHCNLYMSPTVVGKNHSVIAYDRFSQRTRSGRTTRLSFDYHNFLKRFRAIGYCYSDNRTDDHRQHLEDKYQRILSKRKEIRSIVMKKPGAARQLMPYYRIINGKYYNIVGYSSG